jgi:hypothetical protein
MPQWGANSGNENKPQNETEYQKSKTFADQRGWVYQREDGTEEVLVALRRLSGDATDTSIKLGTSNLTAAYLLNTTLKADTTGVVRVVWNERITPTTTGTVVVRNFTSGTNITATRRGTTSSNFIDYHFAVPNQAGIKLGIQTQTITQGVNDYGSTTITSDLVVAAADLVNAGWNSRKNVSATAAGGTSYVTTVANTGTAITAAWFKATSYGTSTTGTVRVYWADPVKYVTTGTLNIVASNTSTPIVARNALVATSSNFVDFTFAMPTSVGVTLTISSTQTIAAAIYNANTVGNTYTSVLVITSDLIAPAGSQGVAFGNGPFTYTTVSV